MGNTNPNLLTDMAKAGLSNPLQECGGGCQCGIPVPAAKPYEPNAFDYSGPNYELAATIHSDLADAVAALERARSEVLKYNETWNVLNVRHSGITGPVGVAIAATQEAIASLNQGLAVE